MFVEKMRKLDSMRKKKNSSEEFEETDAATFGIFSGLIAILRLVSSEQNREKIYGALLRLDSLPKNIPKVKGVTEDDVRTECILAHLGFPVELDLTKGAIE